MVETSCAAVICNVKLVNATQLYEVVAMSLYNIFSLLVDEGVTCIIVDCLHTPIHIECETCMLTVLCLEHVTDALGCKS